jgi:hypothetical protein
MDKHPLLPVIETYLRETGIAASTFGQKAVKQSTLVQRLRLGGSIGWRTENRIRQFMKSKAARQVKPKPRIPRRRTRDQAAHA